MKKIFCLVVMAMSMLFAANAMASTSVESVTAVTSVADYEGDYVGQISNVTMNGKSYDPESATLSTLKMTRSTIIGLNISEMSRHKEKRLSPGVCRKLIVGLS